MLYYAISCYIMLYNIVLYYVISYCMILLRVGSAGSRERKKHLGRSGEFLEWHDDHAHPQTSTRAEATSRTYHTPIARYQMIFLRPSPNKLLVSISILEFMRVLARASKHPAPRPLGTSGGALLRRTRCAGARTAFSRPQRRLGRARASLRQALSSR